MLVKLLLTKLEKEQGEGASLAFLPALFFMLFVIALGSLVLVSSLRPAGGVTGWLVLSAIFTAAGFILYRRLAGGVKRQNRRLRELRDAAEAASAALKDERYTSAAMRDALKGGLFLMDKNFVIQERYSHYMETLLGIKDLRGKRFTDLIAPSVKKSEITSLIEYFVLLFNRPAVFKYHIDEQMLEELNPIHEMEYTVPGTGAVKILRCNFFPVDRGNGKLFILGNIHDITSEKRTQEILAELYDQGARSREKLAMKIAMGQGDEHLFSARREAGYD
jgi:hypothetical protein